ncbi:MAG: hypothetical protein JO288_08775, partial [Hyphomicrobiales bacterium]|nr:hypothetical protein [Hyphomicrobiales bacterium]
MSGGQSGDLRTPRTEDLGLQRIANQSGFSISLLPSGAVFAMEHALRGQRIMVNQVLASPLAGGMARLVLRIGGASPAIVPLVGAEARSPIGVAEDR